MSGRLATPKPRSLLALTASATLLLTACSDDMERGETEAANVTGDRAELRAASDRDFVNISGKVVSTTPSSFQLDYGRDTVTVEMDDWDFYNEGRNIKVGDEVVVSGRVDDNLYANKTVEASSVYVANLNSYFYASGADEERLFPTTETFVVTPATGIAYTGWVTAVDGRTFTMGSQNKKITVDTSKMSYNPLDRQGFQQIKVGDRIHVWGDVELKPGAETRLLADGVVSLTPNRTTQTQSGVAGA